MQSLRALLMLLLLLVSNPSAFAAAPSISTRPAAVTNRVATLNGNVNPRGAAMDLFFEFGATTAYGNRTATNRMDPGVNTLTNYAISFTNARAGTFHFRAVGVAGGVLYVGGDAVYVISPPTITPQPPYIFGNAAQIFGAIAPRGWNTVGFFEWGLTDAYGETTPAVVLGETNVYPNFSSFFPNLAPGTYYYRQVALYDGERVNGPPVFFSIAAPTVQTREPSGTADAAVLMAYVSPEGALSAAQFEWGTTTNYGQITPAQSFGSRTDNFFVQDTLRRLPPGEYHYRAILTTARARAVGEDRLLFIPTPANQSAQLDGTDFIRTSNESSVMFEDNEAVGNKDIGFDLWFKADGPGVLINEVDNANVALWDVAMAEVLPSGMVRAGFPGVPALDVGAVALGTWHHLAVTYDSGAKALSVYLDGSLTGMSTGERATPKESGRVAVYCFGRGGTTNLGGGAWFVGCLDEIHIWNKPLTWAEVETYYSRVLVGSGNGLRANWRLDAFEPSDPRLCQDFSMFNNFAWHVPGAFVMGPPSPATLRPAPIINQSVGRAHSAGAVEFATAVNPGGVETTVYFEFGEADYSQRTVPRVIGSGPMDVKVQEWIPNLRIGSGLQFRVVASNVSGVVRSAPGTVTVMDWAGLASRFNGGGGVYTAHGQNALMTNKNATVELWFRPLGSGVVASETALTTAYDVSLIEVMASGEVLATFNGLMPISLGHAVFNGWNHVALRYDGVARRMDGFLNGVKSAAATGTRIMPMEKKVAGRFAFGRAAKTHLGSGVGFSGDLDEMRVWNLARTDEDLSGARFNLLAGDEPGLILYWRLSLADSSSLTDFGPLSNHGASLGVTQVISDAPLVYNVRRSGAGEIEAQFTVAGGATFRLESTFDFLNWSSLGAQVAPASGYVRVPRPVKEGAGAEYFRVFSLPTNP